MSGLCPYCKRSKVKLYKIRTNDYDPNNRRLGDVYFVEKKVIFCCLIGYSNDIYSLCLKKLKNLFASFVKK